MASARPVRDSDTALWLHNKLGSTEELWVSSSIGGIIKTDTIDNIYRCFPVLTTTVKMKLLLGILHLPRRSLEEMKHTIDGLVELAMDDVDHWVKLIANIVKTYPMMCKLNLDLSTNDIAANMIHHLEAKVKESDMFSTLPLECQYVNKYALQNMVGNLPPSRRHFALKRKPKSAALRVDLMQKSTDASSQAKRGGSLGFFGNKTVPVKHRDMTRKLSDASPMKGIPKTPGSHRADVFRSPSVPGTHTPGSGLSRSASRLPGRSERGTKLLDISEQPVAVRDAKRRKKQQPEEEVVQQPAAAQENDELPEYAQGLVPPAMAPEPVTMANNSTDSLDTDSTKESEDQPMDVEEEPAEPPHSSPSHESGPSQISKPSETAAMDELPSYAMPATPSPYYKPTTVPSMSATVEHNRHLQPSHSQPPLPEPFKSPPASQQPQAHKSPSIQTHVPSYVSQDMPNPRPQQYSSLEKTTPPEVPKQPSFPQVPRFYAPQPPTQQAASSLPQQQNKIMQPGVSILPTYASTIYQQQMGANIARAPYIVTQRPGALPQARQIIQVPVQRGVAQNQQATLIGGGMQLYRANVPQQAAVQQPPAKKDFTLTQEQMSQAQELFSTANKLGRQEKSIILGFLAGSRNNPFPDRGDILQIPLSEHEQNLQVGTGVVPVILETFFEMNYRTGETSRKRRIKPLGGNFGV